MVDDDFQQHEKKQAQKRREVDLEITNDARAERFDTGRRTNRGFKGKHERKIQREKRDKERLSHAIKMSAEYAKQYNAIMNDLDEAMPIVYNALEDANKKLAELEGKASTLPNGTKVYKNRKGEVVTEDGLILSAAEAAILTWRGDEPTWEEHQRTKDRRDQLEQGFDRLGEIQEHMDSKDKPSAEELEEFEKEIKAITNEAIMFNKNDHDIEVKVIAPDNLPDLSL